MWDYARRYYELAWLPARRIALEEGLIADYKLLVSRSRDGEGPHIHLITIYGDKAQFDAREPNFRKILDTLQVPRPLSVDSKKREEIFASTVGHEDYGEGFGTAACS